VLGNIDKLEEIVRVFKAEEIVFCSKDVSAKEILEWMVKLGPKKVHYKIAPEASSFIIGSHSKNSTGEFFTEQITLRIADSAQRRKKRLFDLIASLILLILSPFWMILSHNKTQKWRSIFEVLRGKRSWVGYAPTENEALLPPIQQGVYSTIQFSNQLINDPEMIQNLNYSYARYYSIEKDLEIIGRNFFV